ncbi:hypothetical protein K4039_24560 [Lyngbya sp. CCAP 1446/10]|uniref:hypothetical protein n=1 Tax=Lyngbya sp. CCAP 1446/10 TaxID=439293 RepID=UPI0022376E76|nr:hypothetical protein [Lyngbya sp. CCAP 1446/10]MCW6053155.1 hypothetical protein [Lyngbya sp. CCAP 1446/10]
MPHNFYTCLFDLSNDGLSNLYGRRKKEEGRGKKEEEKCMIKSFSKIVEQHHK